MTTTQTFTVSSVPGAGSKNHNETGGPHVAYINRIKVTPSAAGGTYQVIFYAKDTFLDTNRLYATDSITDNPFVDAVENDGGTITQRDEPSGFVFRHQDKDNSYEWHVKVINDDASARNFTIAIDYDDPYTWRMGPEQTLTIASGSITLPVHGTFFKIETEGLAATDDLDTIDGNNRVENDIVLLRSVDPSRDPTAKDNVDNLRLNGDFTFTNAQATLAIIKRTGVWLELFRSTPT